MTPDQWAEEIRNCNQTVRDDIANAIRIFCKHLSKEQTLEHVVDMFGKDGAKLLGF